VGTADLALPIVHDDVSPSDQNVWNGKDTHEEQPLVLVVDDNADMRAYLIRLLTDEYRVVSAGDGAEALGKIRQLKPDLVVADIMMPVMTGNELTRAIRQDDSLRAIPIILLTARAGTEARVQSLEAGADDYVSKPFNEEELLARIKNQLRIHRQSRELESRTIQLQDLYAKLEVVNSALREMSMRKSEFVSIVSHDLRTPLTAIGAFSEILLEGVSGPLNQNQRHCLERVKANVDRMARMIADLLDLAKIEAGTIQFQPKAMSLGNFVENLVENLRPVAQGKCVNLRTLTEGMDFMVHGDPDKVAQILTNLVHNAINSPRRVGKRIELKAVSG
jgi:CheY-like chemotaxis protein